MAQVGPPGYLTGLRLSDSIHLRNDAPQEEYRKFSVSQTCRLHRNFAILINIHEIELRTTIGLLLEAHSLRIQEADHNLSAISSHPLG